MNFYNPYLYSLPAETVSSGLLSKLSFSSIISGTSKTLNLVNQAIPIFKQMSPIMKNAKTIFSVMNEFKKADEESIQAVENVLPQQEGPTFFI